MNMLMFLGGLILLVIGANALVRGASKLALSFGISPLVVGLTIVAFGTSAPEVAVSVGAVLDGRDATAARNSVLVTACVRRARPAMAHLAPTLAGPIGQVLRWQGPRPRGMVLPGAVQARPQCCAGRLRPVVRPAPRLTAEWPKRRTGMWWTDVCSYSARS